MNQNDNSCMAMSGAWSNRDIKDGSMLPHVSSRRMPEKVPAWLFVSGDERILSSKPVHIAIREEGSVCFAECNRLHVFAQGNSRDEAIDALHRQVVYFFNRYTHLSADAVIGKAAELRTLYVDNFRVSP